MSIVAEFEFIRKSLRVFFLYVLYEMDNFSWMSENSTAISFNFNLINLTEIYSLIIYTIYDILVLPQT